MPIFRRNGHVIEDEGTAVVQRTSLNFTGDGVSVADTGGKSVVTIDGGAAGAFSGARVSGGTPTSVPDDTATAVVFDTEAYDTDGYWDAGAPTRITIADEGTYHIGAQVEVDALDDFSLLRFWFRLNGTTTIATHSQKNTAAGSEPVSAVTLSTDYEFAAADYVQVFVYHENTGATTIEASNSSIWIHKVSSGPAGPEGTGVPVGGIIMWSGTIASIPSDWALCDGTANSPGPDLRDKFVVGATSDDSGVAKTNLTGALTASGAAAVSAHTLTTNVALSAHTLSTNVAIADHTLGTSQGRTSTASTRAFVTTTGPSHTITQPVVAAHTITQPVVADHTSNWPSYYALAFIQRMA